METKKFKIVSTQSNIDWVGKKVTGAHNGTIAFKDGEQFAGPLASDDFELNVSITAKAA